MQFQSMQEFLVLSETLNYLAAAEQLYISQATLSKHIKELEKELDAPLFKRSTRKVELTELGMRMIPYARRAVQLQADLRQEVEDYKEKINNQLTIGCIDHWDTVDLGKMTIDFQALYPNIQLSITTGNSSELMNAMNSGTYDFVIVREDSTNPANDFCRLKLSEDPLFVFLTADHPMADRKSIPLIELKDAPFIMSTDVDLSYEMAQKACLNSGFIPNVIYRGGRPQAINYLSLGLGVGLMLTNPNDMGYYQGRHDIVRVPVEPKVCADINLIYQKENLTNAGKAFLQFAKNYDFNMITVV